MRDKTKEGLEGIKGNLSGVGRTAGEASATFKARMKEQAEVVKQVEADIKSLEKQLSQTAPGKGKMQLASDLSAAKKVLSQEKNELSALNEQFKQSSTKQAMLRTQIRNLKEEMAGMTEGTAEYTAAMQRLGKMQDRMGDVSTQGRIFADDNKNIKATMDAISGLTGAMTAGVGIASLFGAEEEKLAQIQTKLQAVMAITMGIQQVANTLNKDSYFTHVLLAKGKAMLAAATSRLSVALGISNLAAKALMATLTLGLSAAVTGLIMLWDKYSNAQDKAKKLHEEAAATAKKQAEAEEDLRRSAAGSVASQLTGYKRLQEGYRSLGDDLNKKKKFIRENKDAFKDLGISVKSVHDAENLLIKNEEAFMQTMNNRALAAASMETAAEKYKEALVKMQVVDKQKKKAENYSKEDLDQDDRTVASRMAAEAMHSKRGGKFLEGIPEEDMEGILQERAATGNKLYKEALQVFNQEKEKALDAITRQNKAALERNAEEENKNVQKFINEGAESIRNSVKLTRQNGNIFLQAGFTPAGTNTDKEIANELPDHRIASERKIQEQVIALMTEGVAKKKELADQEYKDEITRIDREEKKVLEHYRKLKKAGAKIDPVELKTVVASYDAQRSYAGAIYENKINGINADFEKQSAQKRKEEMLSWDDYLSQYGNFIQKRDALRDMYNRKIADASTQGEKAILKKQLEESMKGLKFDELKSNIDFSQVFGNLDHLTTSSLSSLRDQLKEYINSSAKELKPDDLKELSDAFQKIDFKVAERDPFSELKNGIREYKAAVTDVEKAQKDLADIQEGKAVIAGTKYNAVTGKIVSVLLTQKQAEENLNKAQNNRAEAQGKINASFHSGVEKTREYVDAAGAALDVLESFGVDVPEELTGLIEGMGQTLDALGSIDVTKPMSIITGALGAIGGIGTAIGGLFRKAHEVPQKMIEQYNRLIDTLDDVIAKHREMLREMAGSDATGAYEETRKLVDKQIAATQKMGTDYLNSNAKRSHTYGYKLRKELQGYADDFNKIGIDFESLGGRMEGLFKLSPEQLNTIKEQLPEVWSKLDDKTREYLESIIASSEAMDDLKDATDEALTGITFDAARDSLKNLLLDADATMSDVAEGFQNYMRQAIVNVIIDKNLKGQIEKWYEQFSEAMSDGVLSEQEKEELQKLYEGIYTDAANMRDNAYEAAGITNSDSSAQSARSGAVTTVTEETASKVEGIARSIQDHIAGMDEKMDDLAQVAHESFDQLWEINENTRYCRKLEQIAEDIAEIKRDGLKTH